MRKGGEIFDGFDANPMVKKGAENVRGKENRNRSLSIHDLKKCHPLRGEFCAFYGARLAVPSNSTAKATVHGAAAQAGLLNKSK